MKKIFTNFSKTDFTHSFDGKPRKFEAGKSYEMEQGIAEFFAKHLIDRELTLKKKDTNAPQLRAELMQKCIADLEGTIIDDDIVEIPTKPSKEEFKGAKK